MKSPEGIEEQVCHKAKQQKIEFSIHAIEEAYDDRIAFRMSFMRYPMMGPNCLNITPMILGVLANYLSDLIKKNE
jgi:hypothetical protein